MKTNISKQFLLPAFAVAGFILITGNCLAQDYPGEQGKTKKTITIHVTKEVDGNTFTIDTTIVTEGDFDADAFLEEKGILNDKPEKGRHLEKDIVILHPGEREFSWNEDDGNSPDTIVIDDDQVFVLNDKFKMPPPPPPHPGMPFDFNFNIPHEFPPMEDPRFNDMLEGLARSFGLGDVMPFGEMKKMVVKKKHNGKKLIITFEDRDEDDFDKTENEDQVIIFKDNGQHTLHGRQERYIIKGDSGERIIVIEDADTHPKEKRVTVDMDTDNKPAVKQQKKVIIKKEETK